MSDQDLTPLGRPGNGALRADDRVEAVVCRDCGALLPPFDTEARRLHEVWDRLVTAVVTVQVQLGASWH